MVDSINVRNSNDGEKKPRDRNRIAEAAVATVEQPERSAQASRGSQAGNSMRRVRGRDGQIACAARAALGFELGVTSSKLTVVVNDGVLSLYGNLDFESEKTAALRCVGATPGVSRVADNVVVR